MLKKIYTQNAPEAIGPYSQAIQYDKLLFSSGQIPVDPENGAIVAGGIAAQAEQVMKNIGAILEKAGAEYASVLKTTCFLSDMNDFVAFNEVYAKYFTVTSFHKTCRRSSGTFRYLTDRSRSRPRPFCSFSAPPS